MKKIIEGLLPKTHILTKKKKNTSSINEETDEVCALIKEKLKIKDILEMIGTDVSKNPTKCPFHSSKNNANLSYEDDVFHCFACENGGSIFKLYMDWYKVDFPTAKYRLSQIAGIEMSDDQIKSECKKFIQSKKQDLATDLIAEHFIKRSVTYTIRDDKNIEMWIYRDGIFKPQGKSYIQQYCREILGYMYKPHTVTTVVAKVAADTFIEQSDLFIEEDANFVAVKNGILNIRTKELFGFSPKFKFFSRI